MQIVKAKKIRIGKTFPELIHKSIRVLMVTENKRIRTFIIPDLTNSKKKRFQIGSETYIFDKACIIDSNKIRYIVYQQHNPYPLIFNENGVKPKADTLTELLNLNFLERFLSEPKMVMLTFAMIMLQVITIIMIWMR